MNVERPRWAINGSNKGQPLAALLYYLPVRRQPADVLCLLDRLEDRSPCRGA